MAHGVVDEADVRAPASFAAVNRSEFRRSILALPECAEVVIVIGEGGEFFAQLAGAHVAVIIYDGGRLARRAGKSPGGLAVEVGELRAFFGNS